jgi:hypothetical protein
MEMGSFAYNVVLLLHLGLVIVGFGSSFVYPVLATKSRALDYKERYALDHAVFGVQKYLTTFPIYGAILAGIGLVVISEMDNKQWQFKQTWISAALTLALVAVLVAQFLHVPNLKAMDELTEKLANGTAKPGKDGGAPKEVAELEERSSKAAMFGGILHLLFLLLIIDMIWKPGFN